MILLAVKCALIAYVYTQILTMPGMLFAKPYEAITAYVAAHPEHEWLWKPIILCTTCVTGQLALWSWALIYPLRIALAAEFIDVLAYLSLALLLSQLLNKYLND